MDKAHQAKAKVVVATDLLALTQLAPPGEWGCDICIGTAQRFGVPMGYGGPHAAFLACHDEYKRLMPGRIIGARPSPAAGAPNSLPLAARRHSPHMSMHALPAAKPHFPLAYRRLWRSAAVGMCLPVAALADRPAAAAPRVAQCADCTCHAGAQA